MNQINTYPIENFLEKANICLKTGQKSLILDKHEVEALYDCLALTMTRLANPAGSSNVQPQQLKLQENIQIKMDGGLF